MSKETPKAGEWWWVQVPAFGDRPVALIRAGSPGGWRTPVGWVAGDHEARPIARIPDPPVPEPTEAEKIDARRADTLYKAWCNSGSPDYATRCRLVAEAIRASDEAAGYVLVPTSGEGFERMVRDFLREFDDSGRPAKAMLRILSAMKGDAR